MTKCGQWRNISYVEEGKNMRPRQYLMIAECWVHCELNTVWKDATETTKNTHHIKHEVYLIVYLLSSHSVALTLFEKLVWLSVRFFSPTFWTFVLFCAEKAIKFNLFNVRFYHLAVSAFCSFHKKNGHLMQYNNFAYKYLTWFACSWHQSQLKWPEKVGQIKIRGKEHVKKLTSIQVDS